MLTYILSISLSFFFFFISFVSFFSFFFNFRSWVKKKEKKNHLSAWLCTSIDKFAKISFDREISDHSSWSMHIYYLFIVYMQRSNWNRASNHIFLTTTCTFPHRVSRVITLRVCRSSFAFMGKTIVIVEMIRKCVTRTKEWSFLESQNFDGSFETRVGVVYTLTETMIVFISHLHKLPSNVHSSDNYVIYIIHAYICIYRLSIYIYIYIFKYIYHRSVSHLDTHPYTV